MLVCCSLVGIVWWYFPHPLTALILATAPVVLLLVISNPFQMVLFFVIFSFFRLHEVFPVLYPLKIPLLLSLASMATLFWHIVLTQKVSLWWCSGLSWLSAFFILVAIGVVLASNKAVAISYFSAVYWKIALMSYAIVFLTRNRQDFLSSSLTLTISGLMVAIIAISNKLHGIGLVEGTRVTIGRSIGSVLGDPNDLALVLMFPVAFALSLVVTPGIGKSQRWLGIISLPVIFFAIIATQSRGGLLGIIAIFGVFLYRRVQNKTLFVSLGSFAGLMLYLLAGIAERASGGAAEQGLDASAQGRLYAWQAAWNMAVDHPLTGVGLNNFYANYFFYSHHWDGINHAVHSTWFGVLAETGFLGLMVFISLIYLLIKTAWHSIHCLELMPNVPTEILACAQAVYAGLIGTVIAGTFLTHGFTWPIYILAALILSVSRWVKLHCSK